MENLGENDPPSASSDESRYELDWAQIRYALQPHRVLFIDESECWQDFHRCRQENMDKYGNYTPERLCKRFVSRVLKHIFQFDLNEEEYMLLELLNLHPSFQRTEIGFQKKFNVEEIDFEQFPPLEGTLMEEAKDNLNNHILMPQAAPIPQSEFHLSKENAALLSVILSDSGELPSKKRLQESEILERLRENQRLFQLTGRYKYENTNATIEELIKKFNILNDLKFIVARLIKSACERTSNL